MRETFKELKHFINNHDALAVVCHKRPDGDALGSICAIMEFLEKSGRPYSAYCFNAPPANFNYLPRAEKIMSDKNAFNFADFDLIITLDCGDLKRTKLTDEIAGRNADQFIINIDHHPTSPTGRQEIDDFADLEIKIPASASTSELVYNFFRANKIKINKNMANCLLTGISADTGNFIFPATSDKTVKISSEMLILGANLPQIIENTWRNKSLAGLKIWGKAMANLQINKKYNFAFTILTRENIEAAGVGEDELEGIANFLSNLHEAKAVMLLTEKTDGLIKGSLRSADNGVDVSRLARALGGGGHTKAAGFVMEGKLEQIDGGWKIT
jgi:phosphoesterase RecJ-like protein